MAYLITLTTNLDVNGNIDCSEISIRLDESDANGNADDVGQLRIGGCQVTESGSFVNNRVVRHHQLTPMPESSIDHDTSKKPCLFVDSYYEDANEAIRMNQNGPAAIRLPSISEFGLLAVKKPQRDEIRIGNLSNDALNRINSLYGSKIIGSSPTSPFPMPSPSGFYQTPISSAAYGSWRFPLSSSTSATYISYQHNSHSNEQSLNLLASMAVGHVDQNFQQISYPPPTYSSSVQPQQSSAPTSASPFFLPPTGQALPQYVCKYPGCNKSFPSRSRLTRHEIVHQGQKNFECLYPSCNKRFSRKDNMLQHYRNHLNGNLGRVPIIGSVTTRALAPESPSPSNDAP